MEKTMEKLVKEAPNTRTKSASEVIKGHTVASWFSLYASEAEKKELLEAFTAWRKSMEDKEEEQSELFNELVKLTGYSIDYEADFNKAIKNLNNRWHGWFCTMTHMDNGDVYAKYEDGSYVKIYDRHAVVFIKGDEDLPTRVYEYNDENGYLFTWKEDHDFVDDKKEIDYLNDVKFTVQTTVAVYPHGMYDDMDWIVDYVYSHVVVKNLEDIANGDGDWEDDGDEATCFYDNGFYKWSLEDGEDEQVMTEHICAGALNVDFERPYHKGAWKAVLGYKYPVEVTEEMTALLNKISDIHNK